MDELITQYRAAASEEDIIRIGFRLQELVDAEASIIACWMTPYYRTAYWRWLRWPEDGNVRSSQYHYQSYVYWVDEAIKEETLEAMREGKTYPEKELIFDQYQE
ncbi:MAG: hypothetical protein R3F11_13680 [Verrucomicrobiales bacterium]